MVTLPLIRRVLCTLLMTLAAIGWAQQETRTSLCPESEAPQSAAFDAATRSDPAFNASFEHCFRTVLGVQMHYVIGGQGRPLVLLHGWPQTWYEWHGLLPELAADHLVIAVDLPGLGDSTGSPPSFDKKTLAAHLHALISETLGFSSVDIAAHDLGAGVAWAYANEYPTEVSRLAVMDFPLPGPSCTAAQIAALSYHFPFFQEPEVPELLIGDEVRAFLELFYPHVSPDPEPIPPAEVAEYARTYERPENLRNGFELYRTLPQDEEDNRTYAASPLNTPVLVLTQQGAFDFLAACYRPGATTVTGTALSGAGHWLNEEAPERVLAELRAFFAPSDAGSGRE